jgi:protein-L-isoaspartate(D-aspartate) O-methyltransferase
MPQAMNAVMNTEKARFNMVEQQIRPWDVLDPQVLELLFKVKREDFVPAAYQTLAFADIEIPLGHGQNMMTPKMEARIVQELELSGSERVLDVGTGSGYLAALLASKSRHVTSVELHADLLDAARARLARAAITNVTLTQGDAAQAQAGVIGSDPFDVIVIGGSLPVLPQRFLELLAPRGRLFVVLGDEPVMTGCLYEKDAGGALTRTELFETVLTPLAHCLEPARFHF